MHMPRSLLITTLTAAIGLIIAPVSPVRAADALGGDAVPGVCMLSRQSVFADAKVGNAADQRLKQLATQAKSQLDSQDKPLQAELQSFQQKAASLSEVQRKEQSESLQKRVQALQQQANEVSQRLQLTRTKAMQTIGQDALPIIADVYKSHKCGLLLNRDAAVLGGNMSHDLTADVVQGLDRKTTTIMFDLEPLPSKK